MLRNISTFYFTLFIVVLHLSSNAQNTNLQSLHPPRLPEDPIFVQPTQSILWEITKEGEPGISYIYAIPPKVPNDFFFVPSGLPELVKNTDQLVMEVDPTQQDMDYLHRGAVPIDSTLDRILRRKTFSELETFIDERLSPEAMDKLQNRYSPKDLSQQMLTDYCLGFREDAKPVDYEVYLYDVINKPLKTLNTGWARSSVNEDISIKDQTKDLLTIYENRDSLCAVYKEYLMAYRRQDLDALWLLSKEIPELGDNHTNMIEARNKEWLQSLAWKLQFEKYFIVVNAVQLPGEYGLLHLLRKTGYNVTPIQKNIPKYKNDPQRYAFPKNRN